MAERDLERLLSALERSGYRILDLGRGQPARVAIEDEHLDRRLQLLVYLWSLGREPLRPGSRRVSAGRTEAGPLAHEAHAATLMLGYAADLDAFAAWQPEVRPWPAQRSSVRVSERALQRAAQEGFGVDVRRPFGRLRSAEVAVTFRPEEVRTYLEAVPALRRVRAALERQGPLGVRRIEEMALETLGEAREGGGAGAAAEFSQYARPPMKPDLSPEPVHEAESPARKVSSGFAVPGDGGPLPSNKALLPGASYMYWFEVGEPVEHSIETTPTDLPLEFLPERARLVVTLFEFDGGLRLDPDRDVGVLRVDKDGTVTVEKPVAQPPVGDDVLLRRLYFPVETPTAAGEARLRCNVYCDGVLVQSRLVRARVQAGGARAAGPALASDLDYSLSHSLHPGQLAALPGADLSVMLNGDEDVHRFRFYGEAEDPGRPFKEDAPFDTTRLDGIIDYCRKGLRIAAWGNEEEWTEEIEPRYGSPPSDDELARDLALLAIRGRMAYVDLIEQLSGGRGEALRNRMRRPGRVEIAASPERFIPGAMFYDAPIETGRDVTELRLCPDFVAARKSTRPLDAAKCFGGDCANWGDKLVVCPSGFWGFRHSLGWPISRELSDTPGVLRYQTAPRTGMAYAEDLAAATEHYDAVERLLGSIDVAADRDELIEMLRTRAQQLVYVYCHGGLTPGGAPYVRVGPENGARLTKNEIYELALTHGTSLVFLNGCRTTAVSPRQLFDLVGALVDRGGAVGVIGTEITVFEPMAARFALAFLERFLQHGTTLGEAVRHARLNELKWGNPLGLVYVPFAIGGLALDPPIRSYGRTTPAPR